ncbi:B12-binding domain-containing radical SAM protein [Actinocrispum sp. NPDC049592]|uniref:B12-binding domain-containing radical SAM protein n=1 Tax=Actinocrispum sp. NPDC049592 TaxID=3154835 RepID=UPI00342631BD
MSGNRPITPSFYEASGPAPGSVLTAGPAAETTGAGPGPLRIKLVAFNPERFSLALGSLDAILSERFGTTVAVDQLIYDIDDLRFRRLDPALPIAEIMRDTPHVVGLSWYTWNHGFMQHVARSVSQRMPGTTLVVGGPETRTVFENDLTALPDGTILVFGEGEQTMCEIIERIQKDGGVLDLPPGTGRVTGGAIERSERISTPLPLDQLPSPLLTGHLKDPPSTRMPSYATTRGCIYRCSFCAWQDGMSERQFPLDRVFEELDALAAKAYDMIWFTDTIFGRDESRGLAIIERLRKWPPNTHFGFELHAQFLTPRLADGVASLPLDFAAIGVQSLAPDVLKATKRSPKTTKLTDALDLLYERFPEKRKLHIDLIFGLPEQTLADCLHGVDVLLTRYPEATLYCSVLQLIPGTAFEYLRQRPGWVTQPHDGDFEVVETPTLTGADFERIRDLLVGLELLSVARDAADPKLRLTAEQAESIGWQLRGTRFYLCPTGFRHETIPWSEVGEDAQQALLSVATA